MKALKKLGQGIAGNLGGGKLRNAMGGLGKGMFMEDGGKMKYPGGGRMSNKRLARMLDKYMMGGKMKYEHGGSHDDELERIDPNDPGFQDFLRATSREYYDEYMGDSLSAGGGSGSFRGEIGDSMFTAVNPALLPEISGRFRDEQFGSLAGRGGAGGARPTRGDQMNEAIRMYEENLASEQAYRDFLSKQKGRPGAAQPMYESTPGGGFRVRGTQSQIDATNPNR